MSAYKGHRGPNVSQYIANLNQLSPTQGPLDEPVESGEDFSAFLNNEFFDINNNPIPGFDAPIDLEVDVTAEQSTQPGFGDNSRKHSIQTSADPSMEFNLNGDFQFTDFNNFGSTPLLDTSMHGLPQQPNHYPLPNTYGSPSSSISPATQGFDQAAKKRKLDSIVPTTHESLDESVRVAAEEDKRRRNTAASARFRVKKKQREQALEQTAKEMQDKATRLEQKVQQLETENAWLKGLITEKNGGKHTTTDLKALLSKHEEASGRSSSTHTDGVGTKA
ncbi:hypothetical protein HBH56_049370 [Parastagonospora nodorum]|uniref:Basic leucine zipper transcription factor merR n=1 Tax=Phaeosphaeria nodorum (strain SN15 / ATCC MYA-4574 / FGSC 10173) TaxID=321614 RepID=METR_PHANO|nr:hypothetical protein SNOG_04964 [Parastagonospora nodorum SN15]KAH3916920.1 hypothetical protein HBH56_049370 [Parastagonospora nodorum]EAT87355.2 hypothetical protein SNOG_04964 [Parastagonospora nodorum SN15]KAH3935763.1 hypothetical protein HBH54_035160 [Parastagonospora nodorum]KAH3964124.1 hypothetical protein HBH51_161010 [Parastagonospora nodorum]KAH3988944.1 hypothetical protein HBH52_024340 [Parastagonospora nodorum]